MKPPLFLAFAFLTLFAQGDNLPWIGVSFKSLTAEDRMASRLKSGVGFRATEIVANGPLAKAGGRNGDLWWKFDDQILVNMGQMVVLLREKKAGDTVSVQYFREGKLRKLDLVLGSRHRPHVMPVNMVIENEDSDKPRRLAKREQIARLTMDGQTISLESEEGVWRLKVTEEDVVILSALVGNDDFGKKLPRMWIGAFMILKQTLQRNQNKGNKNTEQRVSFIPSIRGKSSNE